VDLGRGNDSVVEVDLVTNLVTEVGGHNLDALDMELLTGALTAVNGDDVTNVIRALEEDKVHARDKVTEHWRKDESEREDESTGRDEKRKEVNIKGIEEEEEDNETSDNHEHVIDDLNQEAAAVEESKVAAALVKELMNTGERGFLSDLGLLGRAVRAEGAVDETSLIIVTTNSSGNVFEGELALAL